jgi:hypothetical protein
MGEEERRGEERDKGVELGKKRWVRRKMKR